MSVDGVRNVRGIVERRFRLVMEARGGGLSGNKETVEDSLGLLDCGLDSLGFATLVVQLEDTFACDPFSEMETLVFPRTFGELVAVYERSVSL